ncbi:alpha/beta fold hydrolase [Actinomadura montaniterrae]|uniref:Alpha/beta hydrolase n=1 Tax=Actinomadura montaniterrae TaxID=1803903 RepID=A0A6L3W3L3_9ACTN|nr:alpha/beta hydrolase [Actinomadura montaniterrae]KAB2386213.1 alpha/beta hydrolase [Actinomadura montaniterrae]
MSDVQAATRAGWRDADLGTRREIEVPGGRIAVFEAGQGEPVVFVHGVLVNANLWRRVVARLSDRYRCVTLDLPFGAHTVALPGADLTPPALAAMVAGAIEALDLGAVTLVGNDSGGAVCQIVATTRPELVGRLVLTSCDAYDTFPPRFFGYLNLAARVPGAIGTLLSALRFLPAMRRLPIAFGWLTRRPLPRPVTDSYVLPACVNHGVRDDLRRVLRGLDPRHTLAAAKRFGAFTSPVLVAWSERDRFFTAAHAERLATDFPDARLEWIPGARTFSPEDQPARLASAIAGFVPQRAAR